jgi:K+-sensing histidine kinase KdpD
MDILQVSIVVFLLLLIAAGYFFLDRYYRILLRKEVIRARRSEHIKTVFLANVSHALRNPLNSIITKSNDIIAEGADNVNPEKIMDSIAQINKDGNQLMFFVSQLLELSNYESGVQTFTFVEVNLSELMASYRREIQRDVTPEVSVNVRSKLSPHCKGTLDTNLMYQLMMHLLQSAARHTKAGAITINYEAERDGLRVNVIDTGEGLPKNVRASISDASSSDNAINLFNQSSGLGLSICKAIVDALNGDISINSDEGKGTTVSVFFPCRLRDKNKGI